ncbi:arylamine N-acetyltransferase family protein [Phormidium tenue]|uniref:Arylamine N-acetyltransferase n=1 Tax=Phormidium tenue NIES-30 TaxID=549789 RepID=A0A1U7J2U0_9CYAN|nr:arylamine N-acetyltransferase [Phormidium tenue]MBD2233260.1 arylamine N-acetyltransferase [Phormidium tenue FACHB-1052]OKH46566.1 arylamine N-acetyltransferase [Phormidium tenue NIES-30]
MAQDSLNNTESAALDLEAYFERIGCGALGQASQNGTLAPTLDTLKAIHRGHTSTIAFENLSSFFHRPVSLALVDLQQKLIYDQRGGYCFEQNLLLRSVLVALGFQVTNLAARVRWNLPEGTVTPRSHMLLKVDIDEASYLADVGFGGLTMTEPLALVPDRSQSTSHEPYRLTLDGQTYCLKAQLNQVWKPLYCFDLQAQQRCDYEVSNWYVSTHPQSLFVNALIAARPGDGCRSALLNNQLTTRHLDGRSEQRLLTTATELYDVLSDEFGLRVPETLDLKQALERFVAS